MSLCALASYSAHTYPEIVRTDIALLQGLLAEEVICYNHCYCVCQERSAIVLRKRIRSGRCREECWPI